MRSVKRVVPALLTILVLVLFLQTWNTWFESRYLTPEVHEAISFIDSPVVVSHKSPTQTPFNWRSSPSQSSITGLGRLASRLMNTDIGPESDSNCVISNLKPPQDLGRSGLIWKCNFSPTFVYHDRVKRTLNVTCKGKFKVNFVNREESDTPRSDNKKYVANPVWKEYTGPEVLPFEGKYADVMCGGQHNYRTQLEPDVDLEEKQRRVYDQTVKDGTQPLSILSISIDAMSRAQFYRPFGLPRTASLIKRLFYAGEGSSDGRPSHRAFLFNRVNSFSGFTAMNLVPLYGGELFTMKDERNRVQNARLTKVVKEWVWDYAASRGYITSYAVDTGNGLFGTRTVCKSCHYRPGCLPHWEHGWVSRENTVLADGILSGFCEGDSMVFDYIMNYTLDVLRRDYPAKWVAFDSAVHHRPEAESGNQIDASLANFLETAMKENPNLVIFLFGDHGKSYTKFPGHIGGHYETLLPFFSITLPQSVIEKRPEFAKNLLENSQRLISYFDVHKTAKSLLHYPHAENVSGRFDSHAVNLLTDVLSPSRTCDEAGLPDWVCACSHVEELPQEKWQKGVFKAVDAAITSINQLHKTEDIVNSQNPNSSCQDAHLKKITSVSVAEKEESEFIVLFDVFEGPASFKLVVHKDLDVHSLKQLTRYAKYSVCHDKRVSIEFCICKNFPEGTP